MNLTLELPEPLSERLEAQAGILRLSPEELALRLLDTGLPRPRPAVQEDLLGGSRTTPRAAVSPGGGGEWRLWADGACSGNPGPGGWGAIVEGPEGSEELSCGFVQTTNNRMELRGAIAALERLPAGAKAVLTTDSRYVVDAIEKKWTDGWKRRGWRKADGGAVKNIDLWQRLLQACAGKSVRFRWVEGHAGDPHNERCDRLAVAASRSGSLEVDGGD